MECSHFNAFLLWKKLPLPKCFLYNIHSKYYCILYIWNFYSNKIGFLFNQYENLIFFNFEYFIYDAHTNNSRSLVKYFRIYTIYGNCFFVSRINNNFIGLFNGNWGLFISKQPHLFFNWYRNFRNCFKLIKSILITYLQRRH